MITSGKVSFVFLLYLLHYVWAENKDNLPYLGIKPIPQGLGYLFHSFIQLKVDFDVDYSEKEKPQLLDCSKYNLGTQSRTKRSTEEVLAKTFKSPRHIIDQLVRIH